MTILKNKPLIFSIIVLLISTSFRLINLAFPFGDYDEGVYIATVRSMLHGFPLIEKTYNSQFPLFLDILTWFYKVNASIWFLRLFPVVLSIAAIVSAYIVIKKYLDAKTALLISLYLGVNSIFLTVSRTVQADMLWVGFTSLSFLFLLLFDQKRKIWMLLLSSIFFISSVLIKANPIFIPVLLTYLIYLFFDSHKKALIYTGEFLGLCILIFLLVVPLKDLNLLFHQSVSIRASFLSHPFEILNQSSKILLLKHEIWIILLSICSIFIGFKSGIKSAFKNKFFILSTVWFIVTVFVIAIYNPLFDHHIVFFIYPAAIESSFAISYLINKGIVTRYLTICLFLLVCVYAAVYKINDFNVLFPKTNTYDNELTSIATYIKENSGSNDYIVTDEEVLQYLANRNTPPNMVDTSYVRISNNALTDDSAISSTREYNARIVVLVSGRLNQLNGYKKYLQENYNMTTIDGAYVFTKK